MALSEARRASLLAYCRIEEPTAEELLTLEGLYDAAVGYLEQAGVSEPEEGTPRRAQYDLCVNFMVLRDFDLREATITGTIVNDNPAFRRLLTQLKLTEPDVSKLDTSSSFTVRSEVSGSLLCSATLLEPELLWLLFSVESVQAARLRTSIALSTAAKIRFIFLPPKLLKTGDSYSTFFNTFLNNHQESAYLEISSIPPFPSHCFRLRSQL